MAVNTKLFTDGFAISPNLIDYKFRCTLSQSDGSAPGFAEIQLRLNLPPTGGNCNFEPKQETVMYNDWTLSCSSWYDPDGDGIAAYQLTG